MKDRREVVKGLETCSDVYYGAKGACSSCPYYKINGDRCFAELVHDAIVLLKEQEPKPVELRINVYGTRFYFCPKCKRELFHTRNLNFCEMCGQAVKWDG